MWCGRQNLIIAHSSHLLGILFINENYEQAGIVGRESLKFFLIVSRHRKLFRKTLKKNRFEKIRTKGFLLTIIACL